jgi:hypothetical protein
MMCISASFSWISTLRSLAVTASASAADAVLFAFLAMLVAKEDFLAASVAEPAALDAALAAADALLAASSVPATLALLDALFAASWA